MSIQFVTLKDQRSLNIKLASELSNLRTEKNLLQQTIHKSQGQLRERVTKLRDENRKSVGETSAARAELGESKVSVRALLLIRIQATWRMPSVRYQILMASIHARRAEINRSAESGVGESQGGEFQSAE